MAKNIAQKLASIRALFQDNGIKGYLLSTRDEYLSEYPPLYAKRLEYLTGFTGSNGLVLILEDTVLFFTDGRYLTQSHKELDQNLFQIFDQQELISFPWNNYLAANAFIGYDPEIFTNSSLHAFKQLALIDIKGNLVDQIWENRPQKPSAKIYNYDLTFAGQPYMEKIAACRLILEKHRAEALIITNPESVCWLLNIRSADIEFSPLLLARSYITKDKIYLFTDIARVEEKIIQEKPLITILPENALPEIIKAQRGKILFDENYCSKYLTNLIKEQEHEHLQNPCLFWKACKNSVEINCMIEAHIQDGIAMCEFLAFLANNDLSSYSEYDLGITLTKLRSCRINYMSDSFPAIIGFQDNGAIIHYRATKDNAKKIIGQGLLLIDSGGQYLGATTDITRVAVLGNPKPEYRKYYTKVLKGHLALAMIKFPNTVTGANLDILARQFLWSEGDDYAHGTGHGVGSYLSVHEGPQNISLSSNGTRFAQGMIVSNEPGFYLPGKFGIRIENMMYVKKAEGFKNNFLEFAMLTLVPYEKKLIDFDLLNNLEYQYLKKYYQQIEMKIRPYLSAMAKQWLDEQLGFGQL